jgi:zinc/manganese transport system permease protein
VFALLIGPPATAIRLVHQPLRAIILAIILGLAYTWLGILLGGNSPWPVSFFITALSFGVYLPVRLLSQGIDSKKSAKGFEKLSMTDSALASQKDRND